MLKGLKAELRQLLADRIRELYGLDLSPDPEIPPRRELGDLAFPTGLQLSRTLRRPPRAIAEEIISGIEFPSYVREVKIEGPGFLNIFLERSQTAGHLASAPILIPESAAVEKTIVEHTNINPNKAAHIGHLRNAVLGDVLARTLRALGYPVEVQNYVDDTGLQLADVIVGFLDLRKLSIRDVEELPEPFDYYCWDLYGDVGHWYAEDPERESFRRKTLQALEDNSGDRATLGRLVTRRIVARHLATMRRVGTTYDLLTYESSILGLSFFDRAFDLLKEKQAIRFERDGKNAGCWIMPLSDSPQFEGLEDPDKVIVRSDGTVTYVGKDIAYQLWKFGLLGSDFAYRYWEEEGVWESTVDGSEPHPSFGSAHRVINVIDARQSYLQKIVRAGLERLDFSAEAERSIHFAYEMVALSTAAAGQLGFEEEAESGKALEMSGRKGIGVKADDLLDQLIAKSREEIARRNRELADDELDRLARDIGTAALRFFMVKATTTRIIAFDFDEALSFEGESGPYLQYSLVRARNIRRKLRAAQLEDVVTAADMAAIPSELWSDDLWDMVLNVAQIQERVDAAAATLELSIIARLALDLAQQFNAVYHRHQILHESDPNVRRVRLAATQIFAQGLTTLCEILGLPQPRRM
ncbi:MAG: arginine--tRNA ligase [Acidobacteriota bacterium]|nr:arginine--tRNA ligase [Acidobacteriota bacterium]